MERSVYVEAPGVPMILSKSEIPPERCSRHWGGPKPGQEQPELSTSHQALFLPRPSTFNDQVPPSVCWDKSPLGACLQCFPVLTTAQHRWAQAS